jgi:ABC-type sulfate/molybdate transport systems ATPase subunit
VFTTHDPRLLEHVDRKVLLRDGRIEQDEVTLFPSPISANLPHASPFKGEGENRRGALMEPL